MGGVGGSCGRLRAAAAAIAVDTIGGDDDGDASGRMAMFSATT